MKATNGGVAASSAGAMLPDAGEEAALVAAGEEAALGTAGEEAALGAAGERAALGAADEVRCEAALDAGAGDMSVVTSSVVGASRDARPRGASGAPCDARP